MDQKFEVQCGKIVCEAESLRGELIKTLTGLIRIPSPSCGEGRAIEHVANEMREIGFDEVRVDGMGNLIGRIGNGPRTLAYDAHIDVVDVVDGNEWAYPPFEGQCDGDYVYGRGVCDQKGAIASLIGAARLIKELQFEDRCTIYMAITVQEEDCEGLCWHHLIEKEGLRPEAVVLTEPSGLRISRGQKGKVQMVVETKGIASHGSAPHLGENAIYKMAPIISGIEKLNHSLKPVHPLTKGSITVSKIESKAPSLCSVPEECRIYLDRRLTRGETGAGVLEEVRKIVGYYGGIASFQRYKGTSYRGLLLEREAEFPSWLTPEDAGIVKAAQLAHSSLWDRAGEMIVWDFSTNGVATSGVHGIPTIGFGPGDPAMAHRRDERVPVDHLVACCAFYAALPQFFAAAHSA
ncbi:MAG: YgeY family selenium metabolism-linked hydrolase [Candidatus Aureabacteria bacterium]|nr:YgeY family selenium metabolism-linked hydrolase [Candidatus Auribacterota bacterium]